MSVKSAADKTEASLPDRNDAMLANVAMLYYKEGLTQNEIALRMGVSRPTVVNYLRQARERNIVEVRIKGASFASSSLSKELRAMFGLSDVYVAADYDGESVNSRKRSETVRRQVAVAGAMAVFDLVQPGDIIGVAWGETIQWLAEEMPRGSVPNLTVCQMIGSMKSPLVSAAESSAVRIASSLGADCYTLHTPALLSTRELAEALKREPIIRAQLAKIAEITMAIFSVGNMSPETHIMQTGIVTQKQLAWYRDQGAVAVLSGRFIDADGRHVIGEVDERMVGITPTELKKVKSGVLVASGADRVDAIRAVLVGGYAKYLVTDEDTGQRLLATGGNHQAQKTSRPRPR